MRARNTPIGALRAPSPVRPPRAFTLVELLVVIGIIALLISILLPTLNKAREAGNTIKCAANLRSIGQGMMMYVSEFKGTFPAAYTYVGQKVTPNGAGIEDDSQGYVHWSSFLYGGQAGANTDPRLYQTMQGWEMFTCPSIENGGLPPTNPAPGNFDSGQTADSPGAIDQQAPRLAYTVNAAILPRNKFYLGFQGAVRAYQYVRAGSIKNASETVLATEWNNNWQVVSDKGRVNPSLDACKSHRPVHGFKSKDGKFDMEKVAPGTGVLRCTDKDLMANPPKNQAEAASKGTLLDWVGRNHGTGKVGDRRTNFLYVDGHVDTKHVRETLAPTFQWGAKYYALVQDGHVEEP